MIDTSSHLHKDEMASLPLPDETIHEVSNSYVQLPATALAEDKQPAGRVNARVKHYILVGPGRWGSSDTWLGIPVKWPNISAARVIVEAGLTNYRVDPSQGTHFFQNLTSFGVGYFTINAYMNDGIYNQALLDSMPAVEETKFLRWVRFSRPLTVKMDGKKKIGVVVVNEA